MTSSPTVSVVLPTYNRARLLERAIDSILDQTYDDFELIIVDDGSTDDTGSVVNGYDDGRINYVEHETNKGASAARNTGISNSRGKYIAFQNSDDVWHEEKLDSHMRVFEASPPNVGVVYTKMKVVEGDREYELPPSAVDPKEGNISEALADFNFISDQMAVVRKECFERVGLLEDGLAPLDDWELWLRISQPYEFRLIDRTLVTAYISNDSISQDRHALVESRKRILESHEEFFDDDSLARHLFFVGHGYCKIGDLKEGRRYLVRSVKTKPRAVNISSLFLSALGERAYGRSYEFVQNRDSIRWSTDR